MICPTCGTVLPDHANFCGRCGTVLAHNGAPGFNGANGAGPQGYPNAPGFNGMNGAPGFNGMNGAPGFNGANGAGPQDYPNAPDFNGMNGAPVPAKKKWSGMYTAIIILGMIFFAALGFLIYVIFGDKDGGNTDPGKQEAAGNGTSTGQGLEPTSEETEGYTLTEEKTTAETETETEMTTTEAKTEATTAATTEAATEAPYDVKEGGVHRYELVVQDVTWDQAFQAAKDKGGYLVHINSQEEQDAIIAQIKKEGKEGKQFYIGGRLEAGTKNYFWVDENNKTYGEILNSPNYWAYSQWLEGEPSYKDGDTIEDKMDILYVDRVSRWTWNDVPADILSVVSGFSGKIGYIIEYEN